MRDSTDRSLAENARLSNRWERIKQGGSFWATERTEVRSIRRAPFLGGLGPNRRAAGPERIAELVQTHSRDIMLVLLRVLRRYRLGASTRRSRTASDIDADLYLHRIHGTA